MSFVKTAPRKSHLLSPSIPVTNPLPLTHALHPNLNLKHPLRRKLFFLDIFIIIEMKMRKKGQYSPSTGESALTDKALH